MVMKGVIKDICGKTQNTSFGLGVLNQTPGASSADLPGLAKITNLASSNGTKNSSTNSIIYSKNN